MCGVRSSKDGGDGAGQEGARGVPQQPQQDWCHARRQSAVGVVQMQRDTASQACRHHHYHHQQPTVQPTCMSWAGSCRRDMRR